MRAAETYAAYARASILRLGGDDEREARRLYGLAFGYYLRARELERARDLWKRARELYERSRGPDYFEIARLDRTYGEAIFESGEVEEGLSVMRRASALEERLTGKTSPWYGLARSNEADALTRIGRFEEAEDAFAAARATLPNTSRGDDGWHRHRHAELLRRTGRWKEALEEDYRARAYYVGWFPEDAYANSWWQTGVALDLIALGRPTEAIDLLERAAVLRNASPAGEERGETLYALARALWDSKRDRRRAIEVAREAREGYRPFADKYGVWYRDSMNAIEAWLRARGVRDF